MAKNVLGGNLVNCSLSPRTGFHRNGKCEMGRGDFGVHLVCARVTEEFLAFSRQQGNDLTVPDPANAFPGLKPGDQWCLCAPRWQEALEAGMAPPVVLEATHISAIEFVSLDDLKRHAVDADRTP